MNDATKIVKPQSNAALQNVLGFMNLVLRIQNRHPAATNIGVMYGPSGYGKTIASVYAQNKTRAIRVEVADYWARSTLASAILKEFGVAEPKGSIAAQMEQAIIALSDNPRRPLIIDEADKLVDKGYIELVRSISDQSQVPVLLIGEEMLPTKIARIERVFGRVLEWYPAQPCDLSDCQKLAAVFLGDVKVTDELLEHVRERGHGRARRIVYSLVAMLEFSRSSGLKELNSLNYKGPISADDVPTPRRAKHFSRGAA